MLIVVQYDFHLMKYPSLHNLQILQNRASLLYQFGQYERFDDGRHTGLVIKDDLI